MCDVRKKLILANVVIEEYKKWRNDLRDFSTTLLMKSLYLSSVYSIKNSNLSYKNTPFKTLDNWIALRNGPVEDSVYSALGYRYMPTIFCDLSHVGEGKYSQISYGKNNSYNHKGHSENVMEYYNDGQDEEKKINAHVFGSGHEAVLNKLIENYELTNEAKQIKEGFEILKKTIEQKGVDAFSTSTMTKYLSELSHLKLWDSAWYRKDTSKMTTSNIYLLKDELTELKQRIKLN